MNTKKIFRLFFIFMVMLICNIFAMNPNTAKAAEEASAISVENINYTNMTMLINKNNNTIVYYSTDKTTWSELEAQMLSENIYSMDISWITSTADKTLYFKGDVIMTIVSVTIPKKNSSFKAVFNKAAGDFTLSNTDDAETFEWRNATDYNWTVVSFDESSDSYVKFLNAIDSFRFKACKIKIRCSAVNGTSAADPGIRQSKEVTVTISARAAAPTVSVNVKKLTVNTLASMEYYDESLGVWVECDKTMSLLDLLPDVFYDNGAVTSTLLIRKAETSTQPYSKTKSITIAGQTKAPTIGDSTSEFTYYYSNGKLIIQFPQASSTDVYEYVIVKDGYEFDLTNVAWTSVKKSSVITLSASKAPENCTIYIRKAGTAANASKNISFVMPSDYAYFTVNY